MRRKTSVLIVDDSRSVIARLDAMLGKLEGVEIVGRARDGAEAVRLAAQYRPDLVLMDIVMPGMDGLSALRLIGATQPDVRVAMLSSVGGRASLAEEAFRLGAIQVLGKPIEPGQITRLLEGVKQRED